MKPIFIKKMCLFIIGTLFYFVSYSQGRDFTFCYGNISVTIFDGGLAEMTSYSLTGTPIKVISGEYGIYGKGGPTELLKIQFAGNEYSYDLIRDGRGTPSLIIDRQGRKYDLCKTSKSNVTTQSPEEYLNEMYAKDKQDKLKDEQLSKRLSAEMKRISAYLNNPQLRKNVPEQFEKVKHDRLILKWDFVLESDKALYAKLDKLSEVIIQENLNKTGDKYGKESNVSLISYMNSTGTRKELPTECILYQSGNNGFYLVPVRINGYVKNGLLYTSDDLVVGKINQDESRFYIDFKDPKGENLRINIYKDWDYARFNFALEEVNYITVCGSSKIPYDCKHEGISIVIKKDAPQGVSLVAALQLFNLINPKQTSNLNSNNTQLNQETEKNANGEGNAENIEEPQSNNKSGNNDVYMVVEEMPEFPGGEIKLKEYIQKAIKYPTKAYAMKVQGKVFVNFVVEKDGQVSNIKIVQGVDSELDTEALRIINTLPKWIPGKQNGENVRVSYTHAVTFTIK